MSPDVSVIIVNWNTRELLLKCISSVIEGEARPIREVIVVDNASTDGSVAAVREKFPFVKVIENATNLGFSKANNIGIRQALGDYICLVNSDVNVTSGCFQAMTDYMKLNPSIGVLGPNILNPDGSLQGSCRRFPTLWNNFCSAVGLDRIALMPKLFSGEFMSYFLHDEVRKVEVLPACFLLLRKEAILQVGCFDETFFFYGEDIDLCKRLWNAGWEIIFLPTVNVIHYHGASSARDPMRFSLEQQKAVLQYWRKHHSSIAEFWFIAITLLHYTVRVCVTAVQYPFRPGRRGHIAKQTRKNWTLARTLIARRAESR